MLYIEELKDNIIDLNDEITHYEFNVVSLNDRDRYKPYDVVWNTNDSIIINKYGNTLVIDIDIESILKEETIILENTQNDKFKIKVLPNSFTIMEKIYKFKITKRTYQDDGSLRVKILSTLNDMEIGWKCTYDGKPINYSIEPLSSDESGYVTIKPIDNILSDFDTVIEFTQDKSKEKISLTIHNTPDGIKKKVD